MIKPGRVKYRRNVSTSWVLKLFYQRYNSGGPVMLWEWMLIGFQRRCCIFHHPHKYIYIYIYIVKRKGLSIYLSIFMRFCSPPQSWASVTLNKAQMKCLVIWFSSQSSLIACIGIDHYVVHCWPSFIVYDKRQNWIVWNLFRRVVGMDVNRHPKKVLYEQLPNSKPSLGHPLLR